MEHDEPCRPIRRGLASAFGMLVKGRRRMRTGIGWGRGTGMGNGTGGTSMGRDISIGIGTGMGHGMGIGEGGRGEVAGGQSRVVPGLCWTIGVHAVWNRPNTTPLWSAGLPVHHNLGRRWQVTIHETKWGTTAPNRGKCGYNGAGHGVL